MPRDGMTLVARAGKEVGDPYIFNNEKYVVKEIWKDDEAYCWIAKETK